MKAIKLILISLSLLTITWILYCVITLPSLGGLGNKTRVPSISVLDNENSIIGSLGDVYGGFVELDQVPKTHSFDLCRLDLCRN